MFGIPMVPHQLGDWVRTQGDKLLIVNFIGTAATGVFSVGQQLALAMLILITSLNKALYPSLYQILSSKPDADRKKLVVKNSYQIALSMVFIGVIGIILTPVFYPYLLGKDFQSASSITQLIIIAMIFESFYYLVVNYIFYEKKTAILAKITFSVALFHMTLSYFVVSILGADFYAIAYSMILSSFIQFLLVWWF